MVKFILVTGGVISGVGKGVIASSTGLLLKTSGLSISAIKIDPYLNIDAGTLSPLDHGEVFVLDDGGEVDLDLGNYERFLDLTLKRSNNITTGKIYQDVIEKERRGDYLGKTVQVVPHITDRIQDWITQISKEPVDGTDREPDACIIELGGTIGDIESAPFVEALRQFQFKVGPSNFFLVHVSLVPVVGSVGEQKSKPTQASVRELRSLGLSPDIIACRSTKPLDEDVKKKISMFCQVHPSHVLTVHDADSLYHVPLMLAEQGLTGYLAQKLQLNLRTDIQDPLADWRALALRDSQLTHKVNIALVGKYTHLQDSYISVVKALQHASTASGLKLVMSWVEASLLEYNSEEDEDKKKEAHQTLRAADGLIIPGGFGSRGTEGMILACEYARRESKPLLGICLGMQIGVIEFARNELGLAGAHSAELDADTPHPVVVYMPEVSKTHMGGTMRLGSRATQFVQDCISKRLYNGKEWIHERHRHRYEINPEYIKRLEEKGMKFVGRDEKNERMEIMEVIGHPYFVGTQFHPEYKSRPLKPSPVFVGLVKAAAGRLNSETNNSF